MSQFTNTEYGKEGQPGDWRRSERVVGNSLLPVSSRAEGIRTSPKDEVKFRWDDMQSDVLELARKAFQEIL